MISMSQELAILFWLPKFTICWLIDLNFPLLSDCLIIQINLLKLMILYAEFKEYQMECLLNYHHWNFEA